MNTSAFCSLSGITPSLQATQINTRIEFGQQPPVNRERLLKLIDSIRRLSEFVQQWQDIMAVECCNLLDIQSSKQRTEVYEAK